MGGNEVLITGWKSCDLVDSSPVNPWWYTLISPCLYLLSYLLHTIIYHLTSGFPRSALFLLVPFSSMKSSSASPRIAIPLFSWIDTFGEDLSSPAGTKTLPPSPVRFSPVSTLRLRNDLSPLTPCSARLLSMASFNLGMYRPVGTVTFT